jgi:GntR family transcriptional regulator
MRPQPLYARLAEAILRDVAEGRLRSGDKLPTEDEFIRAHGVSRVTVRQALGLLRERGLIERFPRRGSFIANPTSVSIWTIRSVEDIVRAGTETDLRIIDWAPAAASPAVAERLLGGTRGDVYRLRGVRSRGAMPLYYVEVYTPVDVGRRLPVEALARRTVLELIGEKLGLPAISGTEEISAGVADRTLARRLRIATGAPVLVMELVFSGIDGRALEYTKAWYRGDQFKRRNQLLRMTP